MQVITYQAPDGKAIDLLPAQAEIVRTVRVWPRNRSGEYALMKTRVARGLWKAKQPRRQPTRFASRCDGKPESSALP